MRRRLGDSGRRPVVRCPEQTAARREQSDAEERREDGQHGRNRGVRLLGGRQASERALVGRARRTVGGEDRSGRRNRSLWKGGGGGAAAARRALLEGGIQGVGETGVI